MVKMTSWQRLEAVIHNSKMTTNAFAKSLSLKRSENLYQIKKGNNGISKELADLVVKQYPEIDKLWLLTGEGTMFAENRPHIFRNERKGVPYFDADLESVTSNRIMLTPVYYVDIPTSKGCDFVVKFFGNAMEPVINSGAMVFAMEVDPKIIMYGQIYLVVTPSCPLIRIVKKGDDDQSVKLIAANPEYEDIVVNREDISAFYIIKGTYQAFL